MNAGCVNTGDVTVCCGQTQKHPIKVRSLRTKAPGCCRGTCNLLVCNPNVCRVAPEVQEHTAAQGTEPHQCVHPGVRFLWYTQRGTINHTTHTTHKDVSRPSTIEHAAGAGQTRLGGPSEGVRLQSHSKTFHNPKQTNKKSILQNGGQTEQREPAVWSHGALGLCPSVRWPEQGGRRHCWEPPRQCKGHGQRRSLPPRAPGPYSWVSLYLFCFYLR